jgi:transposase-like protein
LQGSKAGPRGKPKIGGIGKTVEIDESKFGKRKYNKGHHVKGQWVFGGVERGSGKTFLVAVHDRTAETLISTMKQWIHPGTTIISDCWASYSTVSEEGYQHKTVNHSITFVDPVSAAHTNTLESTWRHVKASLNPYNRQSDYVLYFAEYMFRQKC